MGEWNKYCKLSLVHFMAFPEMQSGEGDFELSIRQIADLNLFNALEIGPVNKRSDRKKISQAAKDLGLSLAFGAQPVILGKKLDLNHSDQKVRNDSLKILKAYADDAAEMDAQSFVVLSGKDPGQNDRDKAYYHLTETLQALTDHTEQIGIHTVLELFDRGIDKHALVGPAEEAARLADKIRMENPAFGLLYDMGHMPLNNETPESALPLLAPYLAEVHLGNCLMIPGHPAYGDKHPRIGYPGGINDLVELVRFLRQLFKVGFLKNGSELDELPWVGFEVKPQDGETSHEILENIKTVWTAAWEQV